MVKEYHGIIFSNYNSNVNASQKDCENCPFYMDDCDGEESRHVCHNPEYVEYEKED